MTTATATELANFWSRICKGPGHGPDGDCWEWTAGRAHGYGAVTFEGHQQRAPRVALIIATGKYPTADQPFAMHSCDYPPCVRPDHLRYGSPADNQRERRERGHTRQPWWTMPHTCPVCWQRKAPVLLHGGLAGWAGHSKRHLRERRCRESGIHS